MTRANFGVRQRCRSALTIPWNGAGNFNRIYSWVADKAAGLDIIASRMDADTNDLSTNGFGNCLTRDGQGQPTASLPMAGFRHTGVQNAVNRTDYAAFGQLQDGLANWTIATGSPDAITATLTPALTALAEGQLVFLRAAAANVTTTPTFSPNGLTAELITKQGGAALAAADIPGALAEIILRYNLANTRWELLNPSGNSLVPGVLTTGAVVFTLASVAPAGWLMFDDTTMGSAASGATHAAAANQALFNILFAAPFTDATCPLLTSTGGATTRAGQGSAAAAWAANCRMSLPLMLGRALAVAGSGAGLTAQTMAAAVGENTITLTAAQIPPVSFSGNTGGVSQFHTHGYTAPGFSQINNGTNAALTVATTSSTVQTSIDSQNHTHPFAGNIAGGGGSHDNMQPTNFLNAMVKL